MALYTNYPQTLSYTALNGRAVTRKVGQVRPIYAARSEETMLKEVYPNLWHDPTGLLTHRNYLQNSGFEYPTASRWGLYQGFPDTPTVTATRVPGTRPGGRGEWCMRVERTAGTTNHAGIYQGRNHIGGVYPHGIPTYMSTWVKGKPGVLLAIYADWVTPENTYMSSAATTIATGDWQLLSHSYTMPPGSFAPGSGAHFVWIQSAVVGDWMYVDDFLVSAHDTDYFDADYPGAIPLSATTPGSHVDRYHSDLADVVFTPGGGGSSAVGSLVVGTGTIG